jgi:hypothetical protein
VWRLYPVGGCYHRRWLTGPWSTQAKVEGIVLKVAWHWGSDSSVINNPLGEPGHTPWYVRLPSVWGSLDGNYVFPAFCGRAPFWGLQQI